MVDRFVVVGDDFELPDQIMDLLRAEFAPIGGSVYPNTVIAVDGASTVRPPISGIKAMFIADSFPVHGITGDVFLNGPII